MRGEPEGFCEFVATRTGGLLRTAWMLTGDAHLAEDLLQAALARTWPHWHRIGEHPEAYVRRVMVRLQAAWWRRRWNGEVPTGELPEASAPDRYGEADERAVLAEALRGLPRRQRQVVVLRHYEDLPEREVAQILGVGVGTVKSQNAKGLRRLRAALAACERTEELR
ncbi:MAG TPA: SigE family RNA polymerase sigma factor [Pseudonocardiaceae bacterium]